MNKTQFFLFLNQNIQYGIMDGSSKILNFRNLKLKNCRMTIQKRIISNLNDELSKENLKLIREAIIISSKFSILRLTFYGKSQNLNSGLILKTLSHVFLGTKNSYQNGWISSYMYSQFYPIFFAHLDLNVSSCS